jgi:hypothetical protein
LPWSAISVDFSARTTGTPERHVSRIREIGALQRAALTWLVTLPVLYLGAQLAGPAGVAVIVLYAVLFGLAETLVSPSMQPLVARSAPEGGIGIYAASIPPRRRSSNSSSTSGLPTCG